MDMRDLSCADESFAAIASNVAVRDRSRGAVTRESADLDAIGVSSRVFAGEMRTIGI